MDIAGEVAVGVEAPGTVVGGRATVDTALELGATGGVADVSAAGGWSIVAGVLPAAPALWAADPAAPTWGAVACPGAEESLIAFVGECTGGSVSPVAAGATS